MKVQDAQGTVIGRRVLRSTISNSVAKFIWILSGVFLTPFILHRLGPTQFGLWALIGSVMAYGTLLDFGIGGAVIKYVAEFKTQGRVRELRSLLATALRLYTGFSLIAILLTIAIAPMFPDLFKVSQDQRSTAIWLVVLMGVGLAISIPCAITTSILRGLQHYDVVGLLSSTGTVLYATCTVLVLLFGGGMLQLVAVSIVVTLFMQAPTIWFIKRIAPEIHLGWRGASRRWVRTLVSFSSWLFVLDLASLLRSKADLVVIGTVLPVVSVTPYALARRLGEIGNIVTDQFMKVILPLASELKAANDVTRLQGLYLTGTRLTLAIFLPIACILGFLARPILTVWVGAAYADYAPLVVVLVLATLIDTLVWPAGNILQGMAQHRPLAIMSGCGAAANVALTIVLTRALGLTGAAFSALLSALVVSLGLVMPYSMRTMSIGLRDVLRQIFLPALLPAVPMAIGMYFSQQVLESVSLVSIAAVAAVGSLVYLIGYLTLSASEVERQTCRSFALSAMRFAEARLKRHQSWSRKDG